MDGKADNISFMIKRIKVHTTESLNDPSYRFPGNYGVEKYLELFSGIHLSILIPISIEPELNDTVSNNSQC